MNVRKEDSCRGLVGEGYLSAFTYKRLLIASQWDILLEDSLGWLYLTVINLMR